MTLHDRLYGYADLLRAGHADTDLDPADHARVTQRIGESVRILQQYGATTRADLVRMFARAEYDGAIVAARVRAIIEGV